MCESRRQLANSPQTITDIIIIIIVFDRRRTSERLLRSSIEHIVLSDVPDSAGNIWMMFTFIYDPTLPELSVTVTN